MAQTTLRDYLQETEDAMKAGHLDEAQTRCQRILNQFPESLDAQRLLGELYLAQNSLEEARQSFDWVLTNDPENVVAYCDRALVCERMSNFETALDCYQQAYELSRGNSQIRRQFNTLSARVGQPGFMFSRAGLARLYVRGDLLPQAVQEWETVLAASADRLDARLGLLETYWRQDALEQVEQLARQIVQDVPGCLKALLLLAYVTASKNTQKAQELLQRVAALDPEMQMAQELFADSIARQPSHPFLQLWQKTPVMLDLADASAPPTAQPADAPASEQPSYAIASLQAASSNPVAEQQQQAKREELPQAIQSPISELPWSEQERAATGDGWEGEQESQSEAAQSVLSWATMSDESSAAPSWLSMLTQSEPPQSNLPMPSLAEENIPVLSTQSERRQPAEMPRVQQAEQPVPISFSFSQDLVREREEVHPVTSATNDEEASFFGPDWLRSLGAESLENPPEEEEEEEEDAHYSASASPFAAAPPEPQAEYMPAGPSHVQSESGEAGWSSWSQLQQEASLQTWSPTQPEPVAQAWEQPRSSTWSPAQQWVEQVPAGNEPDEQNLLATLETLEQDLYAQGFIPLEPNSLSTIARSHAPSSSSSSSSPVPAEQAVARSEPEEEYEQSTLPEEEYEQSTLSSAFAQFGPLAPRSLPSVPMAPTLPTQTVPEPVEPSWATSLHSVPAPAPLEKLTQTRMVPEQPETPAIYQPAASMPPAQKPQSQSRPTPTPTSSPVRKEVLPGPVYQPAPALPLTPAEPARVPVARSEALLDSELEVTMKRPAIRVQAMQQRATTLDAAALSARERANEVGTSGKQEGSGEGYRERLLRGYQHQLLGDYDEAMQEYRLVIRSAPELLDEVVSNVRALLKLAPKYSAGYRVLGDAYMRQGEYLQAMEAYNKALTMAKKAKG